MAGDSINWTVALTLLAVTARAASQSCDDVDIQVCQGFASKTNVCSDPCLSKLCPRTCNICPLKCYQCDGLSSPDLCNITQICPDRNYNCIVAQSLKPDFSIIYRQGCATSDVCDQLFGIMSGNLIGKRIIHNGECCYDDLCNNRLSREGIINSVHPESTPITPNSPTSSVCDDVDQTSCQRLATIRRDMCTDDCIFKACPRTCGKCVSCYSCAHVSRPEICSSIAKCEPGEKCYAFGTLNFSGERGYRLGCIPENVCKQYDISRMFGRRSNLNTLTVNGENQAECKKGYHLVNGKCLMLSQTLPYPKAKRTSEHIFLTMDGNCCDGDLCNDQPLVHTTTTSTTTTATTTSTTTTATTTSTTTTTTKAPTTQHTSKPGCDYTDRHDDCPIGFRLVNGRCYMIGTNTLSFNDSVTYCKAHCSRLAEDLNNDDFSALRDIVQGEYVYFGVVYSHGNNTFLWLTRGITTPFLLHHHTQIHNPCLLFSGGNFKLDNCLRAYKPLCQAQMK